MSKIRADLVGVVLIEGKNYAAGAEIPDGAKVDPSLVEGENASESDENQSKAPEATSGATEAPKGDGQPEETEDEDFSDLLGGETEQKEPAKASSKSGPARKASARKG